MLNHQFIQDSLEKFSGCDSNEEQAGSVSSPSIWMFGIEFGTYKSKHDENSRTRDTLEDDEYSIHTQLKWPYNRKAFKLLAAMKKDYGVSRYIEFAEKYKPFAKGSAGYFKGNIYPYPCNRVKYWPESAIKITGASSKSEYIAWCKEYRIPLINAWVNKYQPKLFIGVGISNRNEFSEAVFAEKVNLVEKTLVDVHGHKKRFFYYVEGGKKLVVIPHFSGPYGLNSDDSLRLAGEFISGLVDQ